MCVCVEEGGEGKINEKETWREYIIVRIIKNIKKIIVRIVWLPSSFVISWMLIAEFK